MTLVPMMLLFLVGSIHCACFKNMEDKNGTWKWNSKIGSKFMDIRSEEDCLERCLDDYKCMAITYKVSFIQNDVDQTYEYSILVCTYFLT